MKFIESFEKCTFSIYSFNNDISFNIGCTVLEFYMSILGYVIKGTVFQILDLGLSFYFMKCSNQTLKKITKSYPVFCDTIKTKT